MYKTLTNPSNMSITKMVVLVLKIMTVFLNFFQVKPFVNY